MDFLVSIFSFSLVAVYALSSDISFSDKIIIELFESHIDWSFILRKLSL